MLSAPRARVRKALTNATEFGQWFGVRFDGPFSPGTAVRSVVVATTADAEVAKAQEPYAGTPFEITIDRIEPERIFSFRWHPFAIEPGVDYSHEPTTLVTIANRPSAAQNARRRRRSENASVSGLLKSRSKAIPIA